MLSYGNEQFKFADQQVVAINLASGNDQSLISAVPGKRIVVLYGFLAAKATGITYRFEDSDGTALTGEVTLPANTAHEFYPPAGVFVLKVAAGKGLRVDVGTSDLDGWLVYTLVQAQ